MLIVNIVEILAFYFYKVRLACYKNKLIVKEVDLKHENHMCDQQTFDHYPENVRLTDDVLLKAQEMIKVDGNKKKIKMHLAKLTGKPVLIKSLHNIQTNDHKEKCVGAVGELRKLYDILGAIPNANVCFITDEQDELVGKLKGYRFMFSRI